MLNVSDDGLAVVDKENNPSSSLNNNDHDHVDSSSALQQYLDHIPISSIPGIKNSPGTLLSFFLVSLVVGNFVLFNV